jgi:hypothetical protein
MLDLLRTIPREVALMGTAIALLLAVAAFLIGRATNGAVKRARQLEAELAASRAETERTREELGAYRKKVADHFTETSEKLHDLTLQYRAVYEHLAAGATELCPEGFQPLAGGLGLDALPEAAAPPKPGAGDEHDA